MRQADNKKPDWLAKLPEIPDVFSEAAPRDSIVKLGTDEGLTQEEAELVADYAIYKAQGGSAKDFMAERGVVWHDIGRLLWKRPTMQALVQRSVEIHDEVRGQALRDEAFKRATEGVDEPVYQKGVRVGKIRKYSDNLLMFLMKAAFPDEFTDRKEITNKGTRVNLIIQNVERNSTPPIEVECEEVTDVDE